MWPPGTFSYGFLRFERSLLESEAEGGGIDEAAMVGVEDDMDEEEDKAEEEEDEAEEEEDEAEEGEDEAEEGEGEDDVDEEEEVDEMEDDEMDEEEEDDTKEVAGVERVRLEDGREGEVWGGNPVTSWVRVARRSPSLTIGSPFFTDFKLGDNPQLSKVKS